MVSLIDFLFELSGCDYISSLPEHFTTALKINDIQPINANDFPISQWNDALDYLFDGKFNFKDNAQAKQYLLARLQNR